MKQWVVVGCRDCHHHWIVEDLREQDTVQCPQCDLVRKSKLVRVQAQADNWETACELRSRVLAQRAGELHEFKSEVEDFGVLDEHIEFSVPTSSDTPDDTPLFSEVFSERVEQRLEHWSGQRNELLKREAEDYLNRRFDTMTPENDLHNEPDRSLDVFEHGNGTISVGEQVDVTAPIRVKADCSPADLWNQIVTSEAFQEVFVDAVRDVLDEIPYHAQRETLYEAGVTGADGGFAHVLPALLTDADTEKYERALKLVSGIGQDGMTILGNIPLEEIKHGPLAVLDASETVPNIAIHLGQEFRERRREQREGILWMLAALGKVADVRLATTGLTVRWLLSEHRADLPSSFSASLSAHCGKHTDIDQRAREAHAEFNPDDRAVRILRDIGAEPGETLLYSELTSMYDVSCSRISQLLTILEEFELVERFGPRNHKQIELLPAASAYLELLDEESERENDLDSAFSDLSQSSNDSRVNTRTGPPHPGGGPTGRKRCPSLHRLSWRKRPEHATVAAAAPDGGVGLIDHPIAPLEDRAAPIASYDDDREELLIGAEYDNPMAWMTSIALGLVNRRVFGRVDLEDRLEDEAHSFQELIDGERDTLRDARCIGWLSDDVDDASDYLDALFEGRKQLTKMTGELNRGEYEDRSCFRGEILRLAHGLAGSAVHLYALIDIDVVRYLRVPRLKQFDENDRADLCKVLAIHTTITSRYGHCSAYRALYESRPRKRQTARIPEVDASDPLGELIGGITIIGSDIDGLKHKLTEYLSKPRDLVEDAPEFAVRTSIETADRTTYAEVVQRIASRRSLSPTRESVTLLRALTGSPLDAANALYRLTSVEKTRDIRLDEVRVALGKLETERLLPESKPTVSKILKTLLRSATSLSCQELADGADVSRSSIYRHLPKLEDCCLVTGEDGEYRVSLPFATSGERGNHIVPSPLTDQHSTAADLLIDVVIEAIDDSEVGRVGDPDDPLGQAFYSPFNFENLSNNLPWIEPWIEVARKLCDDPDPKPTLVQFGATIEQTALPDGELAVDNHPPK